MNDGRSQFGRRSLLFADLVSLLQAEVEGRDQSVHLSLGVVGCEAEPDDSSTEGCQWVLYIIHVNF